MKNLKSVHFLIVLGCFLFPAPSDAQVGKLVKETFLGIKTNLTRLISRGSSSSLSATGVLSPLIFAPGQPLPGLTYKDHFSIDPYPLPQLPTEMYRGMRLDAKGVQLRHILKNGLEVAKTESYLRESYDGKQYPVGTKAIFATDWIREATFFAQPNQNDPVLSVLFHLKRVGNSSLIQVPHDIPVSWIYRVSAWLLVEGEARWGEIKLDENNNLIFTPYPKPEKKP